ncbi:hypothetical protein [Enorma massiliensis]|uniref:hypothetical protein n=1 Tax=Enorma massiliensis TaxID=1472761 RepID=UPI003A8D70A5
MALIQSSASRAIIAPIIAIGCALAICTGCSSTSGADTAADSKEAYLEEQTESQDEETTDPTANWERIEIPGVGSIQIPPSMEVQDGAYQAMKEALTGTSSDTFVIQQRGLNEDADVAYNTYARILVSYDQGERGDYRERDYDGDLYSSAEISELDAYFEQEMRAQLASNGIEVIEWYPFEFTSLNGTPCLHMSYSRVGDAGETTQVDVYGIPCNDRFVRVTLSYRVSDADMWADDLDLALHSIEFE